MKTNCKIAFLGITSVVLTVLSCAITAALGQAGIESPSLIAAILMTAAAGVGALYFMASPGIVRPVPVTVAAVAAMLLLTNQRGGFIYVMAVIGTIVSSVVVARCARQKNGRVQTILVCDVVIGAAIALGIVVTVIMQIGSFSISFIADAFNSYFDGLSAELAEMMSTMNIYDIMSRFADVSGYTPEAFYAEYAESVITSVKVVSPAIVITAVNVYSYLITAFFCLGCKICKWQAAIPDGRWITLPNIASAHVFCISTSVFWIMQFITTIFDTSVFVLTVALVAENLMIILIPVFCLRGLDWIRTAYRTPAGHRQAVSIIVLTVISILFAFSFAFIILATVGAMNQIIADRIRKFRKQNSDNFHNGQNDR